MTHSPTRTALFLAITGLLASHAGFAQTTTPQTPVPQQAQSSQEPATLDTVEVRGEFVPEPMARTSEVAQFVTREDFKRTGDSDAAEALTRVTGLSLVSDKFVYVRGLGERYSSALLNGSPLPSPEPLQRVVPLDLFPAEVLQGITVQKTYSAKYPGEFGGGVIDLQSLAVPDAPFLSLSLGTGGNSETTGKRGLTYYGSRSDWTGYDGGTRKIPAEFRAALASGNRIDQGSFTLDQLKPIAASLANAPLNLLQETDSVDPDFKIGGSAGYVSETDWGKLGFVAVAGFENKWRTRNGVQQEGATINEVLEVRTDYDFTSTQNQAKVNVLLATGAELGENHKVGVTTLYVHDTLKEGRSRTGYDDLFGGRVRDDFTEWFERDLVNNQVTGSHAFGEYRDLTIDWRGSFAKARRKSPYEKGIRYSELEDGSYETSLSREFNYTRFSFVDDKVLSGGIDATWRLPTDREMVLSSGVAYSDNDRTAESREFRYIPVSSLTQAQRRQRVDFLLSDFNIYNNTITLRETTGSSGAAAYDATLKVKAGYVQFEAEIVPLVRGSLGVRYEDATQSVKPFDLFGGGSPQSAPPLVNDYFLPAATVTWNFADNQQVRFGASKTIARPQFRELAPQQYLDPDSDRLFIGNPFLVDSELRNYDVRYEWFFGQGEYFTAAGFYKDINRPVESVVNEAGATIQQTYINAPAATLYGVELDFKKYFGVPFSGGWWTGKRFYTAANYTHSRSRVEVKQGDTVIPFGFDGVPQDATLFVRDGAQLQGQSDNIANLQLGIEDAAARTQATLIANYVDDRIAARGRPGQPDLIQKPGATLDFVLRQGIAIGGTDVTLSFEARNITGTEFQEFQELGGGRVDVNRYGLGRSFSVSISASF